MAERQGLRGGWFIEGFLDRVSAGIRADEGGWKANQKVVRDCREICNTFVSPGIPGDNDRTIEAKFSR
jgi:hypothetical protein